MIWFEYLYRKAIRRYIYQNFIHGNVMEVCGACNGSGRYDHHHSPRCSSCNGLGKSHIREVPSEWMIEMKIRKGELVFKNGEIINA